MFMLRLAAKIACNSHLVLPWDINNKLTALMIMWYVRLILVINGAKNIPVKMVAITPYRLRLQTATVALPYPTTVLTVTIVA